MTDGTSMQVGTTASSRLLDEYQAALQSNLEAAHYDNQNKGFEGVLRGAGLWGSGALVGTVGAVAATALTNIPGTVLSNPVLSAMAIAGAVVGGAGAAFLHKAIVKETAQFHEQTAAHLTSMEDRVKGLDLPDLKEQLENRRAIAQAQANQAIAEESAKSTRRNAFAFAVGMGAGSSGSHS